MNLRARRMALTWEEFSKLKRLFKEGKYSLLKREAPEIIKKLESIEKVEGIKVLGALRVKEKVRVAETNVKQYRRMLDSLEKIAEQRPLTRQEKSMYDRVSQLLIAAERQLQSAKEEWEEFRKQQEMAMRKLKKRLVG